MTVARPYILVGLGFLALIAFVLAWMLFDLGRSGDMRDAEADFFTKMRAEGAAKATPSQFTATTDPKTADAPEGFAADADQDLNLDDWYAESAGADSGGQRVGTGTSPE